MKITMYELLGLVKDNKAPKKIKYKKIIYELDDKQMIWTDEIYRDENAKYIWLNFKHINSLNDEVEILEEEKKIPEKLEIINEKNCKNNWKWKVKGEEYYYNISTPQKIIADKLNEVLDYFKNKGE